MFMFDQTCECLRLLDVPCWICGELSAVGASFSSGIFNCATHLFTRDLYSFVDFPKVYDKSDLVAHYCSHSF